MKSFHISKWLLNKDLLYKVLIFIITVSVIVSFLPQEEKFNYQFDINKPWKYGLLQASFDFPIYKNENQVQNEQDSLLLSYKPYFQTNNDIKANVLNKFNGDFNKAAETTNGSARYRNHIHQLLSIVYDNGIVSGTDLTKLRNSNITSYRLVDHNTATIHPVSKLLTVKEAYEYIINYDTVNFDKNILRECNVNNYITPNIIYDEEKSEASKKDLLSSISWASGFVMNGQKIIDRGEIVDQNTYNILESLKKEWSKKNESLQEKRIIASGQIIFVSMFVLCFMLYLELFRKDYYLHKSRLTLLFIFIILFPVLTSLMVQQNILSVYIIPFAMIPIIIRVFLDSRTAFMVLTTVIMLSSITLRYPYEFILLQVIAGLVAIFSLKELTQRSQLLKSAFVVFLCYAILYFSLELIQENNLTKLNTRMYLYFMMNGIFLLFTYPLLFILEKIFGFTSNVTLVELSNINNPILREMSEVAPGTFQHSMQVANLAAAAANKIGAKAQLVRTGALYHDIGKTVNPAFFTENQSGINPHSNLKYEQSAHIVISHITDGMKLADKHDLPKVIKNFITTHHGKGLTKYFYISAQNENPDKEIDKTMFTYPGPNPSTREEAILMMADSVEAASRSLSEYTEDSISQLVEKIIDSQVSDGYFKVCPITFKDIADIKAVFKEKLKTMYHTRISYPELNK